MTEEVEQKKTKKRQLKIVATEIFTIFYLLVSFYIFKTNDPYLILGSSSVFLTSIYYISVYFDKNNDHFIASILDWIVIAHLYYMSYFLFTNGGNEEFKYVSEVNLFFIIFSFVRLITINGSSHLQQFLFFLIFGFNYYMLDSQTQIPIADLLFFNGGLCLFFILCSFMMDLSKDKNIPIIQNLNLLLSAYVVSITFSLNSIVFNNEFNNNAALIICGTTILLSFIFRSFSYSFASFIIGGSWIYGFFTNDSINFSTWASEGSSAGMAQSSCSCCFLSGE